MANIGDALKAAVGVGVASVTASAAASCSPSKSDGGSVSTAPSTPETPSPRAKKQGQHLHPEHAQGQERPPEVAAKPVVVEKRKQLSPERKEIINILLARVKAPTPVKPAAEDEDDDSRTTAGETRMPTAVVATPEKKKQTKKIAAGKINNAANKNNTTTPVPSRKPMPGRKAVGGKVGGAFAAIPGDESSAAAATPASNITPDIFAPTPSTLANGMEGIVTAGSSAVHTPTLTPMRGEGRVGGSGSFARRPKSQIGRSKSDAIPAVVDPRGSPSSFAQMLLQKQQQLTPPKQEHPRTMAQGNISLGGLQKKKKQQPQQQQSKPRRKLTPPPKSKGGDATASAFEGLGNDEDGETTMIQGRNLNDAIENTFFKDYWDAE